MKSYEMHAITIRRVGTFKSGNGKKGYTHIHHGFHVIISIMGWHLVRDKLR
jgi:hypothetical protein